MSTTPRYASVQLSAERRREAEAAAEAARRRVAEAARRLRDAELQRRRAKFEQQRAEMIARNEAKLGQVHRSGRADSGHEPDRRAAATSRRSPKVSRRDARPPVQAQQLPTDPRPIEQPQAAVNPAVLEAATGAVADATAVLEAIAKTDSLADVAGRLRNGSARLNAMIDSQDEPATLEATRIVRELVLEASAAYDSFVEEGARRRIIAGSLAAALPERYVVGDLTELPDGTISFHANGPDDDLLVEILDDGTGKNHVTYRIDGMTYFGQIHAEQGDDDCPGLTLDLEQSHARAAADGLDFGPVTWAGGRSNRSDARRQGTSVRHRRSSS
jgi:hypothetical protein